MDAQWRIELFGGLRVMQGGTAGVAGGPVASRLATPKTGALLAYLAYYLHRTHPRETLIELLWPDAAPEAGRWRLSVALSALRRQLEPSPAPGFTSRAGTVLITDRTSVRLNPAAVTTDVAEFQAALEAAERTSSDTERAASLAQAAALYRGELLAGHYQDWVLQERAWLAERYFLARGVSLDPLREDTHRELIRLYAASGQMAAALRQYRELEQVLQRELGTTPNATTRALVREIERRSVLRSAPRGSRTLLEREQTTGGRENHLVTALCADIHRCAPGTGDRTGDGVTPTLRLLQAVTDALVKYEGRLEKCEGARVLAVFGMPQAHEDDAERAIRAALEIREAAERMGLTVTTGIDTGELLAGDVDSERTPEARGTDSSNRLLDTVGPAVQQAADLREQARPGEVIVGQSTYHLTRRAFVFTPLSRSTARGSPRAGSYAVARPLPRPQKPYGIDGRRAPLIGRDEELSKLQAVLAKVFQGRGQIVSLTGEAGVGKSRLVAELKLAALAHAQAENSGTHAVPLWLEGRCIELSMTAGYSLFVDLFQDLFAWRPGEDERTRAERLVAFLRQFVARQELSAERVEEMGPLLGHLLSVRFGTDWDRRLKNASPEQIRHQTLLTLRDLFVALAKRQPVILVLEDLHWADSLSLDAVALLMEELPHAPLLLLCLYRPEREHRCSHLATIAERKCPEQYTELRLRELTASQSRRLVKGLLGGSDPPASVRDLVLERARGNPFFIEEVVRSMIDGGGLRREGDGWRVRAEVASPNVPQSIQSLIRSRVDRLAPELKGVLEGASVIGRLVRRRLLEHTLRQTQDLDWGLWELEERAILYQERMVPEVEYSFQHVLTQETIYRSLPASRRAMLHQQVGEAIEALYQPALEAYHELLAHHYERSAADEKAVEYLLKAGEKARRAYLNAEATGYFQRALARLEGTPLREAWKEWRLEALTGLGAVARVRARSSEAEEHLRQAIAVGQEIGRAPHQHVRLYYWLADVLWWQNRFDEMISIGEEGLTLLEEDAESVEAAMMNQALGVAFRFKGNTEKSREFNYRNARFLRSLSYSEELGTPYLHVAITYALDRNVTEAMHWLQALERQAILHHDLRAAAHAHLHMGWSILEATGDLRGAVSRLQNAQELFARIGERAGEGHCLVPMASLSLSLGELGTAREQAQQALECLEETGHKTYIARSQLSLGTVALCQGAPQQSLEAFQKADQRFREANSPEQVSAALALGQVYLALGDRAEARQQFERAFVLTQAGAVPPFGQRSVIGRWPSAAALSGLEEAFEEFGAFHACCCRLREAQGGAAVSPLTQWFLEPTEPSVDLRRVTPTFNDAFAATLAASWAWHDPFGDSAFTLRDGLEIHAANGRDLWHLNLSAPRLLQRVSGEFAVQTACVLVATEKPAVGGLLLWKDQENFLRLDKGTRGAYEISFTGYVGNNHVVIGRGRLPAERVFLRLERLADRVNALCSADGQKWFTVGGVLFSVEDPVDVGLYAIGNIDRTWYPGAYTQGTATRFEAFELTFKRSLPPQFS
jgi:adenylate cyclase